MGYSFKEILKEDEESDSTISLAPVHLKLIGLVLKNNELTNINKNDLIGVYNYLNKKVLITNGVILTKLLLVLFFNDINDLKQSVETKDTSKLYLGPFYVTELEYWDETIVKDYTTDYETCEQCAGTGEEESECWDCNGTGRVEGEEEGETENCVECDGSGTLETECTWCDGDREETIESPFYELYQYSTQLFSKEKINDTWFGEIGDVESLEVDKEVLIGRLTNIDTVTVFDTSAYLEQKRGRITTLDHIGVANNGTNWLGDII